MKQLPGSEAVDSARELLEEALDPHLGLFEPGPSDKDLDEALALVLRATAFLYVAKRDRQVAAKAKRTGSGR